MDGDLAEECCEEIYTPYGDVLGVLLVILLIAQLSVNSLERERVFTIETRCSNLERHNDVGPKDQFSIRPLRKKFASQRKCVLRVLSRLENRHRRRGKMRTEALFAVVVCSSGLQAQYSLVTHACVKMPMMTPCLGNLRSQRKRRTSDQKPRDALLSPCSRRKQIRTHIFFRAINFHNTDQCIVQHSCKHSNPYTQL